MTKKEFYNQLDLIKAELTSLYKKLEKSKTKDDKYYLIQAIKFQKNKKDELKAGYNESQGKYTRIKTIITSKNTQTTPKKQTKPIKTSLYIQENIKK